MADRKIARAVTSPETDSSDRLMTGESSDSRSTKDCAHWIAAYRELLTFKESLLTDMDEHMKVLSRPASAEIQELDVRLIEMQQTRYRRRLEFWLARQKEIGLETEKSA
jgi:tRNA/tmRNA/rRNA uracil-C5-methylase (TrmA/RlmC/RlmD family)